MKNISIKRLLGSFDTECSTIAADKSISHRCAIFSLLSDKPSTIKNFLKAEDTLNSLKIAEDLGAVVSWDNGTLTITPPVKLKEPNDILDCGNAGTAMRLYCGLLSGIDGTFVLTGDKYLRNRPMNRVVTPLRGIGAKISGRDNGNLAPLCIQGNSKLQPFKYHSPIDSAQVKSAMILAGMNTVHTSYYKENILTRDHTERMLTGMGVNIESKADDWIAIFPPKAPLAPLNISVPSDPSSGFFFAVAAAIIPNSKIVLKNMSLNPTRVEAYEVLRKMGAAVEYELKEDIYEPIGDITISYTGKLKPVTVSTNIAWLIDELPALAIAMACSDGTSTVSDAHELRAKESDRISSILAGLKSCDIECSETEDGYSIVGGELQKATINSFGDHRIAMSFAIAGLMCSMEIADTECIDTSFPNFMEILESLREQH
jgi:3-phosphoshikimate 1-carboxyvinyltransferase